MRKITIPIVALLLVVSTLAMSLRAGAQASKQNAAIPTGVVETRVFPLKNVPKAMMLQWLESRVVKNGTTSVFPDVISVWDWRAVTGENAIAVRGKAPSLQVLQGVIDGLEQSFAIVECDVYVAFLRPGESEKLRPTSSYEYGRLPRSWEENDERLVRGIFTRKDEARQKLDLMLLSPDAYVLSGKGVLYNGFLQTIRLVRSDVTGAKPTRKMSDLETNLNVTTTFLRNGNIEFFMDGLVASSGENFLRQGKFGSGIVMTVKNEETFFIVAPKVPAALSASLEKAGAPHNAEVVIAFTPHVLKGLQTVATTSVEARK